eukprot:Phypoly_transcript_09072.p1 GENE.Phypoly_transcript_09072~~Phypoly_transcript_09072.p1  ORF type:complete len:443 (+),score=47.84 Phypoly_transcript_09072:13-1341(+)
MRMGAKVTKPTSKQNEDAQNNEVYLQWKKLKEIPPDILQNTNMCSLILDFNEISEIPPEIGKLTSLVELSIAANQVKYFPPELGLLTTLQDLNLGMNKPAAFNGDFLTSLRNLRQFHLSSCAIETLPKIDHLAEIKQISLSDNNLDEFFAKNPDYPFPPKLDTINLSQCRLTRAPNFVNALTNLTSVDLSENKLQELPESVLGLAQMKRLFLGGNHLSSFPAGFGRSWKNLVVLSIPFNNFSKIPHEITSLHSLKNLDIRGNGLELNKVPTSLLHLLSILNGKEPPEEPLSAVINIDFEDEKPDLISDSLYLGCLQAARNKWLLQKLGITHVLTVAQFKPFYPELFTYKVVEIEDANSVDIMAHFKPCMEFIDEALASGGKVLVHCRAGVSRSATVVTAYIMHKQKLNRDDGLEFVRTRRERILPNHGFYKQLGAWETSLAE